MYTYTIREWLLFFYAYCFFGWVFESTVVSIKQKKFINRGFMKGPFLPIYGTGAIIGLFVTLPVRGNYFLMYFAGAFAATLLEYVTGVLMEKIFKVRYWDYSYKKIQFQGHICLSSTIAWGFMIILLVEVVHRPIEKLILFIESFYDGKPAEVFVYALTIYFVADLAGSFHEAVELREMLVYIEKVRSEAEHIKERMDEMLATAQEDIEQKKEQFIDKKEQFIDKAEEAITKAEDVIAKEKERVSEKAELYRSALSERRIRMVKRFYTVNPTARSEHFKIAFKELKENVKNYRLNNKND